MHAVVSVVDFNGKTYKLDGHTRSYLWSKKKLAPPASTLIVTVFKAETMDDVRRMYECCDNSGAVKNSADNMFSALNSLGYAPKNILKKSNAVFSVIKQMTPGKGGPSTTAFELVPEWFEDIIALDSISGLTNRRFPAGFVAAFLAFHRLQRQKSGGHPEKVIEFCTRYKDDDCQKVGALFCPVFATREIFESLRNDGESKISGHLHKFSKTSIRVINCFKKYLETGAEACYRDLPKDSYTQGGKFTMSDWVRDHCLFGKAVGQI